MPWHIEKGGGTCSSSEWAVIKDSDGSTAGCHSSEEDAKAQQAALYANESRTMTEDILTLSHVARIQTISERSPALMEMLKTKGLYDADLMESHPPFFFRAEISNDLLDSHFTHMSEKTLRNYARDALAGVAFLKGHDWRSLPIGYSLSATYEDLGSKKRVVADFYTLSGLSETNDLILRMRSGILRDVSVGFHGGEMRCDICGMDFWECRHYPGLKYETKEGDVVKQTLATFTIDDAGLSEVSGVFDGSTPDAMVLKAQRHAALGLLDKNLTEVLEKSYRVSLPTSRAFVMNTEGIVSFDQKTTKERKMDVKQVEILKDIVIGSGLVPEDQRANLDEEAILVYADKMRLRIKALEPEAVEGRQYRTDLIAEALAEGVRAHGNEFEKGLYEGTLQGASIATIKRFRDDWKKIAQSALPPGRSSVDNSQAPEKTQTKSEYVPDEFYA